MEIHLHTHHNLCKYWNRRASFSNVKFPCNRSSRVQLGILKTITVRWDIELHWFSTVSMAKGIQKDNTRAAKGSRRPNATLHFGGLLVMYSKYGERNSRGPHKRG